MNLNGVGGWTEFRIFNLLYLLKDLHLQYAWENECCACCCNTVKCLKLMEVRKQKYVRNSKINFRLVRKKETRCHGAKAHAQ